MTAAWHPVTIMWAAAGWPDPDWTRRGKPPARTPQTRPGVCCLTGAEGPVFDARDVVSDGFNDWGRMRWRQLDTGFSPAAAWTLRNKRLKARPHALTDGGGFAEARPSDLRRLLSAPLAADGIVCVPISRQKHVVPFAQLARVATDNDLLPWSGLEAGRLADVARLRGLGFSEAALAEDQPRWPVLSRIREATDVAWVLDTWGGLAPWRERPAYMEVACRATRQDKETG